MSSRTNTAARNYVIATDSRKRDEILFMVDRRKQRASFWSDRLDDAMTYADIWAATRKARSLRFNNARVLPFSAAVVMTAAKDRHREREEDYHAAMAAVEDGWDGHKNAY